MTTHCGSISSYISISVSTIFKPMRMDVCTVLFSLFSIALGGIQFQGNLKPLGSYPPLQSVTILDSIPAPDYFYKWFIKQGQPVLLKSALDSPDFKNPAYQLWTDAYLREKYGHHDVTYELHKKETRDPDDFRETSMADFIQSYKTSDIYMVLDLLSVPQMLDDVYLPPFLRCGGAQKLMTLYNMWFSSGGTKSVLHKDSLDNINCLLEGTKEIIFFDQKYQDAIEANGFIEDNSYSTVDVDQVDLDKFPEFKSIPWIKASMEKGDCLFIPQHWYHQVNSYGSRNLAVNQWFERPLWFNMSDCDNAAVADLPLSQFPTSVGNEVVRTNIFAGFTDYPQLHERNLQTLMSDKEKAKDVFDYLNTDGDDHVTWEEVHHMELGDFLLKFKPFFSEEIQQGLKSLEEEQAPQQDAEEINQGRTEL